MNGTHDSTNHAAQTAEAGPAPETTGSGGYGAPPAAPPARIPTQDPRTKSPALASFLSCMPGLGQVYVGYYQRGFVHAIVVASIIALLATGDLDELIPLFAVFLAFFWLYNIIDAGRRASLYNQVLAGGREPELPADFKMPSLGGSIFGGLLLIGAGFILLLHTRFDMPLEWIEEWWPVVPIVLGVFLVVRAVQERSAKHGG